MSDIKVSSLSPQPPTMALDVSPITPAHQVRSTSAAPVISLSDRSYSDIKRKLEVRLADTKARLLSVGKVGESLIKQQDDLMERIKDLEAQPADDEIQPELRSKLADLETGFKEVERESAKFIKPVPFLGKENMAFPRTPGDSPIKSEFTGHGLVSPSKISPRKARNATPRQHDIEFAADIGQGLLEEVRKLQALLAQRDAKISELSGAIAVAESRLQIYDLKVREMQTEHDNLRDDNWTLHGRGQDIQADLTAARSSISKLTIENNRLNAQNTTLTSALETTKAKNADLMTSLAEIRGKYEVEMSSLRRAHSGIQRDRSDLQRHIEELRSELSKRQEQRVVPLRDDSGDDELPYHAGTITPIRSTPTGSPQLSPIKNTPSRNAPLELETTKSSLQHAHRLVNNLRNNLHREKTEKLELKRLLAAAQDEVEQLRNKAMASKRGRKRPQLRRPASDMLGGARHTLHEISFQDESPYVDVPSGDSEGPTNTSYYTAYEGGADSDAAFVTATEHEIETDGDAYRTGLESQPESGDDDDLTETESSAANRMPSFGFIRELSPAIAFTSDEEDSPIRPPLGLRHRRSVRIESGRRVASSSMDPPPQPLFQELMGTVDSPSSVMDSPRSVNTAIPFSFMESQEVETAEIGCQCDPVPDPEPIVVEAPPVIIYKERELPPYNDSATQSDPLPPPEPIFIQSPPITVYKERERPPCVEVGAQSDPIHPPEPIIIQSEPIIIYKEVEKPPCMETSVQCDPVPDPEPILIESPPVIVYKEIEKPGSTDATTQSDPVPDPEPIVIESPPVIVYKESEKPETSDAGAQSDPMPPPEPVIIQAEPIIIRPDPIIEYVEKPRPPAADVAIQSDPIPPPEPIIIRPDPIVIQSEPIVITKLIEPEKPVTSDTAVQSDPIRPPTPVIIYKERIRPIVIEMAVQSDPVPEPDPIFIESEPVIIYQDIPRPLSAEIGVQSEPVPEPMPKVVYVDRMKSTGLDVGVQSDESKPDTESVRQIPIMGSDKEIQTNLSIPFSDTYRFQGQTLPPTTLRPRTPISIPAASTSAWSPLGKQPSIAGDDNTPRTVRTIASTGEWGAPPKSPLRDLTNTRPSQPTSPSRSSMRYVDSPTGTYSSRMTTPRRYGTILEHPTLRPSPRYNSTRGRNPSSPSKFDQRRISPSQSRINMSVASRSQTAMSRRTSISSFESEMDDRFGLSHEQAEGLEDGQYATATDPRIIQAITVTMIGEFLYKYTRNQMQRSRISDKRHLRFFWIHPYTKTLYWSSENPAVSTASKNNTRSVPIQKVKVVSDDNPYPPGAYKKSIMCMTQARTVKMTAQTQDAHERWLLALNHLLDRGPMLEATAAEVTDVPSTSGTMDYSVDMREFGSVGTSRASARLASMSTTVASDDAEVRHHGSFGRLSAIFRGDRGTMSTVKAKSPTRSVYEASLITDESRQSHEHVHDIDDEGLENVRACCGGKHDVGTLSRKTKHIHK